MGGARDAGEIGRSIGIQEHNRGTLYLKHTNLAGSRNVNEWSKALGKMSEDAGFIGMSSDIERVDEWTLDQENSTLRCPHVRGSGFMERRDIPGWNNDTRRNKETQRSNNAEEKVDIRLINLGATVRTKYQNRELKQRVETES